MALESSLHDGEYRNRARKSVPKCSSWKILPKVATQDVKFLVIVCYYHVLRYTSRTWLSYAFILTASSCGSWAVAAWSKVSVIFMENPWKTLQALPNPHLQGWGMSIPVHLWQKGVASRADVPDAYPHLKTHTPYTSS